MSQTPSQIEFSNLTVKIKNDISNFIKNELESHFPNLKNQIISSKSDEIVKQIMQNLEQWFDGQIPEKYKKIVLKKIHEEKWSDVIEAFKHELIFGTSGIRGKLSISLNEKDCESELISLNEFGFNSEVLRGSNSINEITIMKNISGLINYFKKKNFSKIVVGYDSRISGKQFSRLISNMFLKENFNVILFDEPNSLPELSFAVTYFDADMGIEITASHNDKRYNGYKLITKSGSPPTADMREEISNEIFSNSDEIPFDLLSFDYNANKFNFVSNKISIITDSSNFSKIKSLTDMKKQYLNQILNVILNKNLVEKYSSEINIGYSALHGTGYDSVSKFFEKLNLKNIKYVSNMIHPESLFPNFNSKQILDPSDNKTASLVVNAFISEYGYSEFEKLDLLCYTDPDADRLGIIIPVSEDEKPIYGNWKLIKANDAWSLFLWYLLENYSTHSHLSQSNFKDLFVVKSFVTSDLLLHISKKFGIECIDGKVGFSDLTHLVQKKWNDKKINVGMFEESCGYGIAGNPKYNTKMHILEKDGVVALAFLIEILSYVKSKKISLSDFLNSIYLESDIGFFSTYRKELPQDGIFEGIKGDLLLEQIVKNVESFCVLANKKIEENNPIKINNHPITKIQKFSTGRYDDKFWKGFPDEGIRFYLNSEINHITIRSSGTEPKIRIFIQYRTLKISKENISTKKFSIETVVKELSEWVEKLIINA